MSKGDNPDFINLYLWGLPFILTSDNREIFREPTAFHVRIPLLLDDSLVFKSIENAAKASKVVLQSSSSSSLVLRWVFKASANDMIGRLMFFQLFVYIPLTNVVFPSNAMLIYGQLIQVVSFELIPADDLYPKIFDLPSSSPYNHQFSDMGFDGKHYLNNMGTLFAMGVLLIMQYLLYILLQPLRKRR